MGLKSSSLEQVFDSVACGQSAIIVISMAKMLFGCCRMWSFGTHLCLRHLGNGGVMMMSQAQKYLWIIAANY
jgi:hypothetical protein